MCYNIITVKNKNDRQKQDTTIGCNPPQRKGHCTDSIKV